MPTHLSDESMDPPPLATVRGRVEAGVGDAGRWLARFNAAYGRALGYAPYPGSLNLRLAAPFDWTDGRFGAHVIPLARATYGGERDILLLECRIRTLADYRAHLWTTTTPRPVEEWQVIELLADVSLRDTWGLVDGQELTVDIVGTAVPGQG